MNKRYEIITKGGVVAPNPPQAVVYLEGSFPETTAPATVQMGQKDLDFVPRLLAVRVGTKVEFPNFDDVYHNIFSYSPAKRFDLGRYRSDEKPVPSQLFDKPGLVTLRCEIHEHMRGLILVLATSPYFRPERHRGALPARPAFPPGTIPSRSGWTAKPPWSVPWTWRAGATLEAEFPVKARRPRSERTSGLAGFRLKLLVAMMLVVTVVAALGLFFAQRNVTENVRRDFQRQFQDELAPLHAVQEARHVMLAELCRTLARRSRIHAALEDNALDLLYPSARDELADASWKSGEEGPIREPRRAGAARPVLPVPRRQGPGDLAGRTRPMSANSRPSEQSQLTPPGAPPTSRKSATWRRDRAPLRRRHRRSHRPADRLDGDGRSDLGDRARDSSRSNSRANAGGGGPQERPLAERPAAHCPTSGDLCAEAVLAAEVAPDAAPPGPRRKGSLRGSRSQGRRTCCFTNGSIRTPFFPRPMRSPSFPMAAALARQRQLAWQFAGAGGLLPDPRSLPRQQRSFSIRLSRLVEKLAVDSGEKPLPAQAGRGRPGIHQPGIAAVRALFRADDLRISSRRR